MRYKLRVTREDGSVQDEEVEAANYAEAKEMLLSEPDVIDATIAKIGEASSGEESLQDYIDGLVGS